MQKTFLLAPLLFPWASTDPHFFKSRIATDLDQGLVFCENRTIGCRQLNSLI